MRKPELIARLARECALPRGDASRVVKNLVKAIRGTLQEGGQVSLSGIGTFKMKARKGREGRNPVTGEKIQIPAGRKISFKPSLSFRRLAKG